MKQSLSNQVRQTRYWANLLFNAGLPKRIDTISNEASSRRQLLTEFRDGGKNYQLELQFDRSVSHRVVDRWTAVLPDGTKDAATFRNYKSIGRGIVAHHIQLDTVRPNGRTEKSTYSITNVNSYDSEDVTFGSLFLPPRNSRDFPALIGEVELGDTGAPGQTAFFKETDLRASQSD